VSLVPVSLIVNGSRVEREVPATLRLVDFLRDDLRLTGAKVVCGEGECGACSIFLDEKLVDACLILAVEAHGHDIRTVESLSGESLTVVQQAFLDDHAVQCGFCIPGMVMTGEALIREDGELEESQIRQGLAGNICRCTGYHKIIDAIRDAAKAAP